VITADQIVAHLIGDYVLQSDWMAGEKTKRSVAALAHALVYSLPFVWLASPSWSAFAVIAGTHFVIDRWRLARYVVWAKNFIAPPSTETNEIDEQAAATVARNPLMSAIAPVYKRARWWHPWAECSGTGYHKDRPPWLAVWLLIIADNTLHLLCNGAALRWL